MTITASTDPVNSNTKRADGWVTDYAWISGLVGALAVVLCAFAYHRGGVLQDGLTIAGLKITDNRVDTLIAALLMCTFAMVFSELLRLYFRDPRQFISIDPAIKAKRYGDFFLESLGHFVSYLILLGIVILFFRTAGEYGFSRSAPYYQPWFRFLDIIWAALLYAGLPYILLTRAFKYDLEADQRDLNTLVKRTGLWLFYRIFASKNAKGVATFSFDERDKKNVRGLLVKLFFTPLMTVFFLDQFPHLVANVGYLLDGLPNAIANGQYRHTTFNGDLFNISAALIFSIDVALAWCGYVISSRWVENQTYSAEPTVIGWMVCILCYPPFQMYLGLYYSPPADRDILQLPNPWIVTLFTSFMVLSYLVYMSVTLWFGVRFSNLTNRGIIRKGPFAFVRHPAYASKNLSWWLVMFPTIIYNATHSGMKFAILQTLGLVLMTWIYYLRSITEERHLMADPCYQEYCEKVKYRFVPGLI